MRAMWRNSSALVLAVAQVGLTALVGGCDSAAAKAQRDAQLELKYASGSAQDMPALQTLSRSASTPDAVKASAKMLLAQAEVDAARMKLHEVDQKELEVIRLVGEIRSVAATIAANNVAAANYRTLAQQSGVGGKEAWEKLAAQVQGGAGAAEWAGVDAARIPTLAAAQQQAEQAKGEIAKLEGQLKDLQEQRKAAESKAAGTFRQSDQAKGSQSVELFTQAWQSQRMATDLGARSVALEAQLAIARRQFALADQQAKIGQAAVQDLQQQAQQAVASGQALGQVADARAALSKSLASGPEPVSAAPAATAPAANEDGSPAAASRDVSSVLPRWSLDAKAADLAALTQSIRTLRQEAVAGLTSAIGHYQEGQNIANGLIQKLQDASGSQGGSSAALNGMRDAFHASSSNIQIASARLMLASAQQDAAASLAARQELAQFAGPALSGAGLTPPPALVDPAIAQELQQSREQAEQQYTQAIEALEPIESGGGAGAAMENSRNAYGLHAVALHGRSMLRRSSGAADAQGKADADATALNNLIGSNSQNAYFPRSLLVSLGMAPAMASPTSAPAPTTEPTTTPAP